MHDEPTGLLNLSDRVTALAEGTVTAAAHAIELGQPPPAGLWAVERELWRWAHRLRQQATRSQPATGAPAPARPARLAAVILLVEIDDPDLEDVLLANAIMRGVREHGTILLPEAAPTGRPARRVAWRIRHVTAHPDLPTALAGMDNDRHADPATSPPPDPAPTAR